MTLVLLYGKAAYRRGVCGFKASQLGGNGFEGPGALFDDEPDELFELGAAVGAGLAKGSEIESNVGVSLDVPVRLIKYWRYRPALLGTVSPELSIEEYEDHVLLSLDVLVLTVNEVPDGKVVPYVSSPQIVPAVPESNAHER